MLSNNNNISDKFKQCAFRGCNNESKTKLHIPLLKKFADFCEVHKQELLNDGLVEAIEVDKEVSD